MILIVPVVVILIAENLGHIKAVNVMTHRNLDPYIGRSFFGDVWRRSLPVLSAVPV